MNEYCFLLTCGGNVVDFGKTEEQARNNYYKHNPNYKQYGHKIHSLFAYRERGGNMIWQKV